MSLFDLNQVLELSAPKVRPPLDPGFRPLVLAQRALQSELERCGGGVSVEIALERAPESISRRRLWVFPQNHSGASVNFLFLERTLKYLLWSRGGWRVHFAGPPELGFQLQEHYLRHDTGKFDAWLMGEKIYHKPFTVTLVDADALPAACEPSTPLGRHWEGARIGFDLGASDRKVAAVLDGKPVFSEEVVWDPRSHSDPQWHFDQIMDSLQRAAGHLPRVDAIGGSSAGVVVNNRVKVASLFRGVPDDLFRSRVESLFVELKAAWKGIPFEVVNDGEVTALAGSMGLSQNAVLGIAMGSSLAAGYVNAEGNITPWLNELAFAPVDLNPHAPQDEWSGDFGCGVQYFSQQAVGRLIPLAGIDLSPTLSLPEKLVEVQTRMAAGDDRALRRVHWAGLGHDAVRSVTVAVGALAIAIVIRSVGAVPRGAADTPANSH